MQLPATNVEETGGANFLFVTKDGKVVTPKSNSILPSITRRSLVYVAKEYLGLEVEERVIPFEEVKDFAECGLCGTAAVISPVGKIVDHGNEICFPSGMENMGPITQKAVRDPDRHPDGQDRSSEGLDSRNRVIRIEIQNTATEHIEQIQKTGQRFCCPVFYKQKFIMVVNENKRK